MYYKLFISLLSACVVTACTSLSGKQQPAPVYNGSGQAASQPYNPVIQTTPYDVSEQPVEMIPFQDDPKTPIPLPKKPTTAAVIALLDDANRNYNAGNFQSAVGSIERALRIEPRNATLIYKLAAIRLKQGKPGMAEDLAKKAALLAVGQPTIKKRSWLLIAEARRLQGDQYGANEAKKYAEQF